MPHYNLSNNQPLLPFSSQQPVIPSQGPLDHPPISKEMQLIEAVEHNDAAAVLRLLQEVAEPTIRKNAYLLAYQFGHIDIALILLKAGAPLIGSLETLAYNAINQGKYNSVSFSNLSAYIREHGLSFNPNNRHGPKQESLQECAARVGSHLALAWLDRFLINTEGSVYDNEFSDQNHFHLPSLGLPDQADSIGNDNDPWNFLIGFEGFDQALDLSEDPTLSLPPVDSNFDPSFLSDIPIDSVPIPSSSFQSLNESSNSTPGNLIDLTLEEGVTELPGQSFERPPFQQEIEQFKRDWAGVIEKESTFLNNANKIISLLRTAKQRHIRFEINASNQNKIAALHWACELGYLQIIRELLDAGAEVNIKSSHGYTPLHFACRKSHWEAVKQLLDAGAEVNIKNSFGHTPLHCACKMGYREIVKQLLDAGAEMNITSSNGHTPLHCACEKGHREIVKQLLDAGALIDAKNKMGRTPLDIASSREIRQLLENARAAQQASLQPTPSQQEIDQLNKDWSSALSERNRSKLLSLLQQARQKNIPLNIDANIPDSLMTPLHLACQKGDSELIRLLIAAKADIHARNILGYTPLHIASLTGRSDAVKLLIEAKADVNDKKKVGSTPFYLACIRGHSDVVRQLIAAKANINDINFNGSTALHAACYHENTDVVKQLLAAGASLDIKNKDGKIPIEVRTRPEIRQLLENARTSLQASLRPPPSQQKIGQFNWNWKQNLSALSQTIDFSATFMLLQRAKQNNILFDIDEKDQRKRTILHFACRYGSSDLVKLLIDAKASVNLPDADWLTPLHHACSRKGSSKAVGISDLVKLLIDAKASVNLPDADWLTPLHYACKYGHADLVNQLIWAGASIEAINHEGKTPLDLAATPKIRQLLEKALSDRLDSLQILPSQLEIDQFNRNWSTALSEKNCGKLHSLLQEARQKKIPCNWHFKNKDEHNALQLACIHGHSELVQLLIEEKAQLNVKNRQRDSLLHLACSSGHSDIVKQLLAAGAIIDAKNKEGKTPFQVAKTLEIRQLLEAARLNANSRMDAPFQSSTPNARKLENAGKQLLKRVAEHYGPRYHTALTEQLIKNRGRWGIDFARYSSRRIDMREWLAPFVQFLEAYPGSETASQVVKQHLAFFQFSDSSDSGAPPDDLSSAESFVEECLRENARQPRAGRARLSDYFAVEACQTLFSLKLREWNYMVNHPERYVQSSEQREDANSTRCPCFILAQDQNQVRAHIMQAHFGKMGFVDSFGKDDRQEALRFLFTEVLKYSAVPSVRIREDESVILSWQEYNTLERYLAELPPSDLPRLLVPMREKLVQPIEEVSETDSSGDETESATDEEPSYRRDQDSEERPAKRRERSPTESLEQDSLSGSFRTFNDLTGSRSSEKRITRKNESVSSTKRHRKNAFEAPEHQGSFVTLEEQLNPFPLDARSKRRRRSSEGEIPEVNAFAGMPLLDDDQGVVFSDNPYDTLNRTSIKKIKEAVAREVARESVVLRQIKPYSYPIVEKLDSLPPAKPAFSWTRSLKPYQEESLQELLRYDSHGLSKLLSLEMGLGKTYVFGEFLIDKIATSPSPQLHVVSAPVSVVGQVQQELSKLLLEASITAWQLTGKRPAGPQLWPQCRQLLDYANNHSDALKSVLRVLPYFKDAQVYGVPASKQFFSMPGLQGQLFSLIKEHLDDIENLLIERPEERKLFEEQLDAIYKDIKLPVRSNEDLLNYFKTKQSIVQLCNIAGRILDLYPGRKQLGEPLPIRSDQELTALRNLGLSPSQIEKEQLINSWTAKKSDPELKSLSETPTAPKICLIGLNDLHKIRDQFPQKHVGALIIDEANRAQNPLLVTSKQLHETIASFRESAFENSESNNVLLVTGTPFENNLNELWNLLELSNPNNLLPRTTCNSLIKDALLTTIRQMINLCGKSSKANEDLIEQYVLISFAQFMGLRNMVQKMVHRKDTSDPQIIEDWKGRIPSKTIRKILYELDPQMRDYLNEVQEGKRSLYLRSVQTQILIHPELTGKTLTEQENKGWPFLEPFRTGSHEVKEAWIKSSPYLSAVLTDAVFQTAMKNNQKRIIFCDRNALSAAFKETIEHFYRNAKVIIYNGDLKRLERDKAIAEFKNESSDHPTVLIAMIKAGGVGLNLAEADGRHICATQWNEGQKRQADARLIRANNVGEKDMPEIEFPGTYYSAHPKAIRKKKRNWENFLWNTSESAKDLFRSWTAVLKAETLQVLLNTTIEDGNRRNTERAKAKNQQISDLLDRLSDSIPEERLNRSIALARGPSSSAGIEQSPFPTDLGDEPATSSSEEEWTPSPAELSDDIATAPAALMNAPIGLGNKSNNCWCNALLQMVASTPSLRASYESFARHYIPNAAAPSSGFAASSSTPQRSYLDEYYGELMLSALNLYDQSKKALSSDVSQNVREALNYFSSGAISSYSSHSEDAYEALSILLQGSDPSSSLYTPLSTIRTYSPLPGLPALPDRRKIANNEYSKLEDGNRSMTTTAVPEILLPLQGDETPNFSNLLRQFFDSPALADTPPATYLKGYGLFKYQLQRIQNQFQSVPDEFLLQLGRFRKEGPQDDPELHKINTAVAVPLILTLPPEAFASPIAPPSYQLDSFIVHSGDLEGGHYFTYKKVEEQWWLCNDSRVEPVALQDIEEILSGGMTTYLHHYTKLP